MMTTTERLLSARREGEFLAFMESDYEDARAEGRWRRGCVRF